MQKYDLTQNCSEIKIGQKTGYLPIIEDCSDLLYSPVEEQNETTIENILPGVTTYSGPMNPVEIAEIGYKSEMEKMNLITKFNRQGQSVTNKESRNYGKNPARRRGVIGKVVGDVIHYIISKSING